MLYMEGTMSQEERRAWIMLAVAPVGYAAYLAMLFAGAKGGALAGSLYAGLPIPGDECPASARAL